MTGAFPAPGVPLARVVAVVAVLANGQFQVGSGYLVTGRLVLTAEHCTRDKTTNASPVTELQVFRASDGAPASGVTVAAKSPLTEGLDLAVLRLESAPWDEDLLAPVYARVDRSQSGMLQDCQAIGYPLFQDAGDGQRDTAELHGIIYQAELAGSGRLVLREPHLETVTNPPDVPGPVWGGLSGAVVFHHGRAMGVVIEHHPRQGASAVQLAAFDHLQESIPHLADAATVATELGITPGLLLPVAAAQPVAPIADLVELVTDGQLPRVDELDPYRLGTSPSNYGNRSNYGAADPYVSRTNHDIDQRLGEVLKPRELVVVAGPSKAGKSRTAFEMLRRRWPDAHLVAPQVGLVWDELAQHPRLRTSADPLVIWLDDLHRFLIGNSPLTLGKVAALTARQGTTVLLGTLRTDRLAELRDSTGELGRDTRLLLESATTVELTSTRHSDQEQAAAQAAYPDQNMDSGLGEQLAHAPQLLAKYLESRDAADPVQYLIVRCAIDWARSGIDRPVPEPDLHALVQAMAWTERPDLDVTDTDLVQGLQWARSSLPGAPTAALLVTHPLPGKVRGYRPFDYLVAADNGQRGQPRAVPDDFWAQVLDRSLPEEAADIGVAAYFRDAIDASLAANTKAAAAGHPNAMSNLGVLLSNQDPPDLVAARDWYQRAADAGEINAMYNLGSLLADQWDPPDLVAARGWYQRAADAGHIIAMGNLGTLLADQWDPPDLVAARGWYQRAADAGEINAMNNLGTLLADQWDPPDLVAARDWYQEAAAAGHPSAMFNLGVLLANRLDPPDLVAARDWYHKAAAAGHAGAMINLGALLADQDPPDLNQAQDLYQKAAAIGVTEAMTNLGVLLADQDPPDLVAARDWYQRAADAGEINAMNNLGTLLADQWDPPDLPAARGWWEQAAAAGHSDAMYNLGSLLAKRVDPPDLAAAQDWYQKAASVGHTNAMNSLGFMLANQEPPDLVAARGWWEQAAAAGHSDAMYNLGSLLAKRVDPPDLAAARDWYQKAASVGHTNAMNSLGSLLTEQDPPELDQAKYWYEKAAASGHLDAMANLGVLMATRLIPPDLAAARDWYQKAAAGGHSGAMNNLGSLLANRLDPPDLAAARDWYQKAAAAGHPDAPNNLGVLLARLDPPDLAGARGWWERAAAAGHPGAMFNLGSLLANQDPPDLVGARGWWEQAAATGDPDAMNTMGIMLTRLDPPDLAGARGWWEQAAATGHPGAMFNLGLLLANQHPPDLARARGWWEQAAAAGHPDAMNNLRILLADRLDPPSI